VIDREESAAWFHNWNERILAECYQANGFAGFRFAGIIDRRGRVESIVNNYTNLSFNCGPTLLAWLSWHTHLCMRGVA
jgi:alpha-amylase/alpha-mannosidase (GH57 family)